MTRDDIIRMAREAGIPTSEVVVEGNGTHLRPVDIERFAALVAAAENEACAKIADNRMLVDASEEKRIAYYLACKNIAAEIRARHVQQKP